MKKTPSPLECRDTALALTFLLLLIWYFSKNVYFVYAAMLLVLVAMVWPMGMSLPARAWFGFSHLISQVTNKIILGILYVLIVIPVAMIRKALGKDAMRLRQWRNGDSSLFVVRDHLFTKEDLDNTF